jgi:hypothetical protein
MKIQIFFIILIFLAGKFNCKESCGSAQDGVLNFMSLIGVSAQVIINVVNAVNNNNNNNNDNNNNNNNNENNDNDNTFMITVTNSNTRRFHSDINLFSIVNELIGNPYGARYPWILQGFKILNPKSTFYQPLTSNFRQCLLKNICQMAEFRQNSDDNTATSVIYKSVRFVLLRNHF